MKQLFILFVIVTAFAACNAQSDGVKNLSQQDLTAKLKEKNTVLIDVRISIEVASGYIPESEYFIDINGANFEQKIAELDTTKTYVIYCRSGARSGRAASYMSQNSFTEVYNLEGGILDYTGKLKQ
jgi:rhodanese-related sulfurtransferase